MFLIDRFFFVHLVDLHVSVDTIVLTANKYINK